MDHITGNIYELPDDIVIKCGKGCKNSPWSVLGHYSGESGFLKQIVSIMPENVQIVTRKYVQLGYLVESFKRRKIVLRIPDNKATEIEGAFNKVLQRLKAEYITCGFLPIKFSGGSPSIFNMEEFKKGILSSINKKPSPT